MRRRDFLGVLGSATAAWPFAARAKQPMPVVGFLHSGTSTQPIYELQLGAFRQGLKEGGGFAEGQNVHIEYRWAEDKVDRLPALAADLGRRKVDVIAAVGGSPSNLASKNATTTIPVVFNTGADPIKLGLVTNICRPGGTGVTFFAEELGGKALGLLHELVPQAKTIGLLINPQFGVTAPGR